VSSVIPIVAPISVLSCNAGGLVTIGGNDTAFPSEAGASSGGGARVARKAAQVIFIGPATRSPGLARLISANEWQVREGGHEHAALHDRGPCQMTVQRSYLPTVLHCTERSLAVQSSGPMSTSVLWPWFT